jgi:pimeloyl-ACP methyl ester carboxylesterase
MDMIRLPKGAAVRMRDQWRRLTSCWKPASPWAVVGWDGRRAPRLKGFDLQPTAHLLATGDITADLARLPAGLPVQLIVGEADVITPPAVNWEIAAACLAGSIHVIPGAGHALYCDLRWAQHASVRSARTCWSLGGRLTQ